MRFDQSQELSPGYLLPPAVYAADITPATYDIGKADACTVLIAVGVGGITFSTTNKIEFVLSHSDVSDSGFAAVAQADVIGVTVTGSGIVRSLVEAHAAATITELGYKGGKRYLRLLADFSGTHGTGTPVAALALSGRLLSVAA